MSAVIDTPSKELAVVVKGEIVTSNFADFRTFVSSQLAYINYEPETDEEFGTAEQDVKMLKTVETSLVEAKKVAIEKMESVNALFDQIDLMGEETRQNRLKLEKAIKIKKAEVKKSILDSAYSSIIATNKDVVQRAELEQAIKGKRNLESIQSAADSYVQKVNDSVSACREVINTHIAEYGKNLIPDANTLELGDAKHLTTELALRVEKAKAEDERKQREKDEADRRKLEAEAAAKIKAEQDEADRIAKEKTEPVKMVRTGHCAPVSHKSAEPEADEAEELREFITVVMNAFSPVKAARQKLKSPKNIKAAQAFAEIASAAYTTLINEGGLN